MIVLDLDKLATRILDAASQKAICRRCGANRWKDELTAAIGGIPGSGKSTVAYPLVDMINALAGKDVATGLGVDGWHYSQAQLRSMSDPEMLFKRRGAHFTFDGASYAAFVKRLDEQDRVLFPTFSHRDKDPVAEGGWILPQHRIVVIEGLHSLLNLEPWSTAASRYDEKVWVDTHIDEARDRIIRRHLNDGVEATVEAATRRAEGSDLLNARTLQENLVPPTVIVQDTSDAVIAPKVVQPVLPAEAAKVLV